MARSVASQGVMVDVATTDDDGPGRRINVPLNQRLEPDGYGLFHFPKQTEFYKVSLAFGHWMAAHVTDYDLVHVHALFSYTSTCAARQARRRGVPYVLRPLGVLNRWGMENRRRLLKSLSFHFVEKPILRHAAAMHYTSRAEQREAEQAGASARPAVIPLGIEAAPFQSLPSQELFLSRFPQAKGRTLILFLSRLDPKKGLDLLLPAFAAARRRHPQAMLVLVGGGNESFVAGLTRQAAELGIADDILWPGFLSGADKLSAFAAASVFVLPSYSENFGIALVEALAAGLPCVTTPGVALGEEVQEHDAGLVVPAQVPPLAAALERLLGDAALRERLGRNGRRLVAEHFTIQAMGAALRKLYEAVLSSQPVGIP